MRRHALAVGAGLSLIRIDPTDTHEERVGIFLRDPFTPRQAARGCWNWDVWGVVVEAAVVRTEPFCTSKHHSVSQAAAVRMSSTIFFSLTY